jgi:diacylglycerol kinase family enzyme
MLPVARALLIINRTAGTGQSAAIAETLASLLRQGVPELAELQISIVSNHAQARACATEFISESHAPALLVAGGGGGTLRAVIEGVCDSRISTELPGPQRVRVGALRMGSGNVLAKQFGVPRDPVAGLRGLLSNLQAGRTVPCCVLRCETFTDSGNLEVHHAVTLGGLGQFGRIPSDLARWHAQFPLLHKTAARLFGVERLTNIEYAVALLIRSIACVLETERAETIEIKTQDKTERLRLLSGLVMNFPVPALPFKPDVSIEDEAALVYLIPLNGRWSPLLQLVAPRRLLTRCIRIEKNNPLEIRLLDRQHIEFFLDEDPVTTFKHLRLGIAGSIAFVPGPDYPAIDFEGAYA